MFYILKITGTSSSIYIEFEGKIVKISGELLVNGFVAYVDSIKNWEPPYENMEISEEIKERIISAVIHQTKNSDFKIEFE
ncbi:Imm74 family immunity protein [Gottfriedia solisilvae]|uniref:Imm74 family immunity protein n=1 Tax=Gottfriedia solisilvae TaxID=1516104 RepID=UPI003D2F00BF